jgi:hypothetical protein
MKTHEPVLLNIDAHWMHEPAISRSYDWLTRLAGKSSKEKTRLDGRVFLMRINVEND